MHCQSVHTRGHAVFQFLASYFVRKATLNAVVLVRYLLNVCLGSPPEKMHAHPRSQFSEFTYLDTIFFFYNFCAKLAIILNYH